MRKGQLLKFGANLRKAEGLPEDWWLKYADPKPSSHKPEEKMWFIGLRRPFHEWDFGITPAPRQCSHFGCNKSLTFRESLFGETCIDHNPANYPSL